MAAGTNPPPPGSNGLPLLGETLAFASNPFAFIHQRRTRFGDVFRTSILGRPTVFLSGPRHVGTWLDPSKVQREGAMPANLLALFGGHSDIAPLLDGESARAAQAQPAGGLAGGGREATRRARSAGSTRCSASGWRRARGR